MFTYWCFRSSVGKVSDNYGKDCDSCFPVFQLFQTVYFLFLVVAGGIPFEFFMYKLVLMSQLLGLLLPCVGLWLRSLILPSSVWPKSLAAPVYACWSLSQYKCYCFPCLLVLLSLCLNAKRLVGIFFHLLFYSNVVNICFWIFRDVTLTLWLIVSILIAATVSSHHSWVIYY